MEVDIAIKQIKQLIAELDQQMETWKNSKYYNTEVGKEMIKTCRRLIEEAQEELKTYRNYKVTRVFESRKERERKERGRIQMARIERERRERGAIGYKGDEGDER